MQDNEADLLFPTRAIASLRNLRGQNWQEFIDLITSLDPLAHDRLAFILMMVRLSGCLTCQSDSFRAMRGCVQCSIQTVKRFRGTDQDLLNQFAESQNEINKFNEED